MEGKPIVIDSDDDDDVDECRSFMVHATAISEHSSAMSEEIDVPIICIDDDEDDLNIDNDYKVFLDILRDDNNSLGPLFESKASGLDRPLRYGDDNAEPKTRKLGIFSGDTKRSKLEQNKNLMNKRVSQVIKKESIERDNRVAERRKRRFAELEAERTKSSDGPLIRTNQECIRRRDNKVGGISELKVETLKDVPVRIAEEDIRRDAKVRKISEAVWDVPLIRTLNAIQRDNRVGKSLELKDDETLWDVPLIREDVQRDNTVSEERKTKTDELTAESLRSDVRLVQTEEENRIAEGRKMNIAETEGVNETSRFVPMERANGVAEVKAVNETSRVVPMKRVNGVADVKTVNETSRFVHMTQMNKGVGVRRSVVIVDEDYMSYLTWLVDYIKEYSTTKPTENLQNDPPVPDTLIESTIVPEKDGLVKVKVEPDLESDDDPDIIEIGDSPFLDGEGTPFVASKSVIDLDKENGSSSCLFTKKLMDDLRRPYDERELSKLSREASIHKRMSRRRELRNGRETDYEAEELAPSYLDQFTDFNEKYERVKGVDKARALKLLRGLFFYLKNCAQDGSFKPWELDG